MDYDEKRDFYRMSVECEVSYNVEGEANKHVGKGTDLSADGVSFITPVSLNIGTKLKIDIHPYINTIKPLSAKAEVIRCDQSSDGYIVAVKMESVK